MNEKPKTDQPSVISSKDMDTDFPQLIAARSGVNLNRCLHCLCCGGGCPFIKAMDLPPNRVIRLVQMGQVEEALNCRTIWVCVGCHTCSMQCPAAIDIAAIHDALRNTALRRGIAPSEPDILAFHETVLDSIRKHGRTHKLEIMMRYKLKKMDLLSDMDVGMKMLQKRKLDLLPSNISDVKVLRGLFANGKVVKP